MNKNQIIFLACGERSIQQLRIVLPAFLRFRGDAELVVYTDLEDELSKPTEDAVRVKPLVSAYSSTGDFVEFGGTDFARLTMMKALVIEDALKSNSGWVLYCDTDVIPLREFHDQIETFMQRFHVFVSGEGRTFSPRSYCTGIIGVNCTDKASAVIAAWAAYHEAGVFENPNMHDQIAFDRLMQERPDLESFVHVLPEGVAMPGWYYDFLYPIPRHTPIWFHANWCVGHEMKSERLRNIAASLLHRKKPSWLQFLRLYLGYAADCFQRMRPSWLSMIGIRRLP